MDTPGELTLLPQSMVSHLINHLCTGEAETRKLVRTWANIIYIEWYIIDIIYI